MRRDPVLALLTIAVALPCALLLMITVRSLRGPIYGIHEWRQGWTYSVAYAFIHESASFFYPKHAWRGHLTGIVGMEVPLYPYVLAQLMRVFGESAVVARTFNFGLFVIGFCMQAKRLASVARAESVLGYCVMAAFSPIVLCEFRQIQPDPVATALAMMAASLLYDHGRSGTRASFVWGLAFYTLALMAKTIVIAILPAMILFALLGPKRPSLVGALMRIASFAIPVVLMMAWDRWANVLVQRYMEGNSIISIDHDPAQMWAAMKDVRSRRLILLALLENYATHVALFPAVLVGAVISMKRELRAIGIPMLAWLAGTLVILLAFSSRLWANWYYMLPTAPPVLFFGALALGRLFEVVGRRRRENGALAVGLVVVLAAVMIRPLLDPVPWHLIDHVAAQLAVHVRHQVSQTDLYWIAVSFALLLGAAVAPLADLVAYVPMVLFRIALAGGSAWAMVIPFRDTEQTVRFYTTEQQWEQGHVDDREIRAAVNRFSRPDELFLMNGWNPALLVRALRVGYAEDPGAVDFHGRDFYLQKGVRFFMTFFDSPPVPGAMQGLPLLARGARWELYCIDPKGCPPLQK